MGTGRVSEQLFDITLGWPRLRAACLLLADNISNQLWAKMGRTLSINLHLCSCLNINYNASEADLGSDKEQVMCLKILRMST